MKKYVIKFGTYSALFLIGTGLALFFARGGASAGPESYAVGEVIGYLTIVLSMAFVFFGVKKYRDDERGGLIKFGEALKMGALIVLFPALAFAIYNIVYVEFLDPEFVGKYYEYQLDKALALADPGEQETVRATMASQKEMFANIPFQSVVMFLTVYVIGFIVNVISALILARKK